MEKEKKEIWMGKLMKYVEEMQKEWINICRPQFQQYYLVEMMLISKHYWLIKWLVDNDKIDFEWMSWHWKIISYLTDEKDYKWNDIKEWVVLMLISISDTPIDFLCEILK